MYEIDHGSDEVKPAAPEPPATPPAAPVVGAYEIDAGVEATPRRAAAKSAGIDLDADRAQRLTEHRRAQDEIARDAQSALARRVVKHVVWQRRLLAFPVALAVPAGVILTFQQWPQHWPGFFASLAAAALLTPLARWQRWILELVPAVEATSTIVPEGWSERATPGQEPPEATALRERRAQLREVNNAVSELHRRSGVAWRQIGAAAVGWLGGVMMPLLNINGSFSQALVCGAGGAAACAAVAWLGAGRQIPVLLVGVAICIATVVGALAMACIAGFGFGDSALAVPLAGAGTVFLGMGVGWWLDAVDTGVPQRSL